MEKLPVAVAVITLNEEENIGACLQSVAFASQIVIVDSGSTDQTLQIAGELGVEVYNEKWRGFGAQKQAALDKCREPWILLLDADERIPPETAAAIEKIITGWDGKAAGFSFPRKNIFQGRWIKHAGWWPDRVTRLFRSSAGRMTDACVHEAVKITGLVAALDFPIAHFTESRLSRVIQKIDKYSTLAAEEAFREGRSASTFSAVARSLFTFLQDYFWRLGMLDGSPGLTLAVTDAINKFFKYAKLRELNSNKFPGKK